MIMDLKEKEIYISFLEAVNSAFSVEELFQRTLEIIQNHFNSQRIQVWKRIEDTNQYSIEFESTKEKNDSMLAIRINETTGDNNEITQEINISEKSFISVGINSIYKVNISNNKIIALCFKDKNKKLSASEMSLLESLMKQFKQCFPRLEEYCKNSDSNKRLQHQNQILREKDRLRTNFINNISHELRTPLSSVLGFSNMLISNKNIPEKEEREIAKQIYEAANRLSNLITDFLEISKIDSDTWAINSETTDIGELIKKSIDEFSSLNKNYKIKYEIASNYPLIKTDPRLLRQVIDNLLSNAIKYSLKNKNISVELLNNEKEIIISIIDNGVGISNEELPKIFNRFFRSDNEEIKDISGTGLGLAICKSITESLSGKIEVESTIGKGSKFTLILPS